MSFLLLYQLITLRWIEEARFILIEINRAILGIKLISMFKIL